MNFNDFEGLGIASPAQPHPGRGESGATKMHRRPSILIGSFLLEGCCSCLDASKKAMCLAGRVFFLAWMPAEGALILDAPQIFGFRKVRENN